MHHDSPFSDITGTCDPTSSKSAGSPALASHANPLGLSRLVGVGSYRQTVAILPHFSVSKAPALHS